MTLYQQSESERVNVTRAKTPIRGVNLFVSTFGLIFKLQLSKLIGLNFLIQRASLTFGKRQPIA